MYSFDKATIRLFNGLLVSEHNLTNKIVINTEAFQRGILFSPDIYNEYSEEFLSDIARNTGLSGSQLNASFHKSWIKILEAPIGQLMIEQVMHYITTYGFESFGIKGNAYIPREVLDVPEIKVDKIGFKAITGYTKEEITDKVMNLVGSGVALSEGSLDDLVEIIGVLGIKININEVSNKELLARLCVKESTIPSDPEKFLRCMVFIATGQSLLIKNTSIVEGIRKTNQKGVINKCFLEYEKQYGLHNLAKIFHRYKRIWLAFKFMGKDTSAYINKMRKLADIYHKPMREDYLNQVTCKIKQGKLDLNKLEEELEGVNLFRKTRLAYALNYRMAGNTAIVHRVRNGKTFARIDKDLTSSSTLGSAYSKVLKSICLDLKENVEDKLIYIPKGVMYALPSSEKKFVGVFPAGSYFEVDGCCVIGIHWFNTERNRVDLDLSMICKGSKVGWDGSYRKGQSIMFSGDMVTAPRPDGAMELFWISNKTTNSYTLNVNHYNRTNEDVPFSIVMGSRDGMTGKFMLDPNEILFRVENVMDSSQKTLGTVEVKDGKTRFYASVGCSGGGRTARMSEHKEWEKSYMETCLQHPISLSKVLEIAGARVIDSLDDWDGQEEYIDLSPANLTKDSILELFY